MKVFITKKTSILLIFMLGLLGSSWGQTNNYFGTTGTLNGNVWSTNVAGPYNTALVATGGAIINFGNNTTAITGATITIAGVNATANATITTPGGTISNLANGVIPINVAPGITLDLNTNQLTTSGTAGYIKNGGGVLATAGAGYGGGFTLNSGTVIARGNNTFGTSSVNLNGGVVAANGSRTFGATSFIMGGDIQIGEIPANVALASNTANLTFSAIQLGAVTRTFTFGNGASYTINGIISGNGGLTFNNNSNGTLGNMTLSGLNSYTGPTTINGGTVIIGAVNNGGANGRLGASTNAATNLILGGGTLNYTGTSAATDRNFTLTNGTTSTINVSTTATVLNLNGGAAASTGALTKTGNGVLRFGGANAYTGATTISSGTLRLGSSERIDNASAIVVNGGTFDLDLYSETVGSLAGTGGTISNAASALSTLTVGGDNTSTSYAGTLVVNGAGILQLTKVGTGIQTLTGANTYTGITTINGGTLQLNRTTAGNTIPAGSTINVANGGTLQISKNQTLSNVSLAAGANLVVDNSVTLTITGTLTVNVGATVSGAGAITYTSTGALVYNGSGSKTANIEWPASTISVTINNSAEILLDASKNMSSALLAVAGVLDVSTFNVSGSATSFTVTGTIKSANANGVIGTGSSFTAYTGATFTAALGAASTINFNAASGTQIINGSIDYVNLVASGGGTKTLSSAAVVSNSILISDAATLNAQNFVLGGVGTTFTMTGTSRYITSAGGTTPDARGAYSLGINTTIEFAGTSNRNIYLTPSYANIDISGSDINLSGIGSVLDMQAGATFTVKTGGTFNVKNTNGFSGAANTAVGNTNNPTIVLETGSGINYDGSTQIITNALPYQNIIFSGAGTKTAPAGTLTVLGNFTKNNVASVFNANGGMVAFNGTGSQVYASTNTPSTIKTATTFYDVTIGNTAGGLRIDADSMNIDNSLTLGAAAKLDLGTGYVILKSTAARTAYIAPVVGSATITYSGVGRFEIERYLFARKSWRSLATPIDPTDPTTVTESWRENGTNTLSTGYGTQITGPAGAPAGFDQTTIRGSLKSFDMNLGDFVEVTNTSVPLYNRSGYFVFVRGDRAVNTAGVTGATTLRMQGKLVVGTQSYSIDGDKFLSVGNPFAARIDMKQAIANTRTGGMVEAFTVWNPNSPGSFNVGAYQTYIKDLTTGDYLLNGIGAVNNFIESGQAVFVQAIAATGSFAINEIDKVSGSSLVSRGGATERTGVSVPTLDIALNTNDVNSTSFTADAALLNFGNFNDAVDVMDVKKTFNTADNIAIKANNQYLVAERKSMPQANDTIFLHTANLRTTNYSFAFDPSLLGGLGLEALLVDRFLGTTTPVSLTDVSTINFTTTADAASKANNRFAIVFKPAAVLPVTFTTITAVRDGGSKQIAVKWDVSTEININRYEVERSATGTNFITLGNSNPTNNTGSAATYVYNDAAPLAATNYYRVKAISNNGTVQYSAVVKVAALPSATGFVVYPNPVVGNTINLQANQVAKGAYTVQLVNATGQIVYNGTININSNNQSTSIALDATTAPGKYTLVLVGEEGKVSVGVVVR